MKNLRRYSRQLSLILCFTFLYELVFPVYSYALTGGPSQPEVQSFEPVGTSDMVDMFSGDFKYNIPLMEVDGYPLNISYTGGINTDQEASWVGLGWNLNPGAVTRNMRGIPDDFGGDLITKESYMKPNTTHGMNAGAGIEIIGLGLGLNGNVGIFCNNYEGLGIEFGGGANITLLEKGGGKLSAGLQMNYNAASGINLSPSLNFSYKMKNTESGAEGKGSINLSSSFNSRMGMKALNFGYSASHSSLPKYFQSTSGSGSLITYGKETYTPSISTPMKNFNLRLNFKLGAEAFGLNLNGTFAGYISRQSIAETVITRPAFGYYYLHEKTGNGMMDMNREKDVSFSENHTNLPIPVNTHDFFSATAQGIGGSFRVYRNDVPNFCEDNVQNNSYDSDFAAELGAANTFKGGVNFSYVESKDESGNWLGGNALQDNMKLIGKSELPAIPEYEPAYFRQGGEATVSNIYKNERLGRDRLLSPVTYTGYADNSITEHSSDNDITGPKKNVKVTDAKEGVQKYRQPRNMVFSHLTAAEANSHGLQQNIVNYEINQLPEDGALTAKKAIIRHSGVRKLHHISEITILNTDGKRYVYGIPAYNNEQTEATFALGNGSSAGGNITTGLAKYVHGTDDVPKLNTKGKDHFVQKIKTPGYAYSYLLTGILSSDYVDFTGGGVTDNDFGTSTRVNYSLCNEAYPWRVPYEADSVSYMEGKKGDFSDDKGSYIYGTKELWHVHSVEGKNHIAMFYISPRFDAVGALPQGGQNVTELQFKLDSIVLYAKQDFLKNGVSAYKIKAVHFDYDYVLCQKVPNFLNVIAHPVKGKLTLKKLWFTYGTSYKGKLSKYEFNYNSEGETGYAYYSKAQDRWGTYKPHEYGGLPSSEFPFTPQVKSDIDDFAAAWSLSEVMLPSGGKISVEYESDDYAYVQNRKAMVMYRIKGFSNEANTAGALKSSLFEDNTENDIVYADIGSPVSATQLEDIMGGLKDVQVTVLADINGNGAGFNEYVKGYVDIVGGSSNYGVWGSNPNYIWFRLKQEKIEVGKVGKRYVNPISKVIWNYARIYTPELISLSKVSNNDNLNKGIKIFGEMAGFFTEIWSMIEGIYNTLRTRKFGKFVDLSKSWVRLNAKDMVKYGGGHRVKSIKINDHWAYMGSANTNAADYEYGQEYDYTIEQQLNGGNTRLISSGVAAYEPTIGNDENPWHQPKYTRSEYKGVPNLQYMVDEPYGESFFPAPTVGYKKVTVKNIPRSGVERTATGKQVHEFYTAYDFPVKTTWSNIQTDVVKPDFAQQMLNFDRKDEVKVTASQGYKIEVNDMHGKPKAEYTYSETSKDPIAGVEYYYNHKPGNANELSNVVKVVDHNGNIVEKELGLEVELFNDFRQNLSQVTSTSADANLDFFFIAIIPVPLPMFVGSYNEAYTDVKTAVMVKLVNRYGLQSKTVAIKEGSRIKTENLLYDELTGNVLVTSIENEFNDNTYNLSYPAHWAYDRGMGPAYKNIGLEINNVTLEIDSIKFPSGLNVRDYLVPGDEVEARYVVNGFTERRRWYVYEGKAGRLNIIDRDGFPKYGSQSYTLKVLRSGRRNLHSVPIQQLNTWHYPIATSGSNLVLSVDSVISASAVEYDEYWPFYCDKRVKVECDSTEVLSSDLLQDLLNELASYNLFKSRKWSYTMSCLNGQFLTAYPGVNAGEFYKQTGDYPDYDYVLLTSDSCLTCNEQIFAYNESTETYHGLGAENFLACHSGLGCCEYETDVRSYVDNHAVYEVMREHLATQQGGCESDSTLGVELSTCGAIDGGTSYRITFKRCGNNDCNLTFNIPPGTCYSDITSFSNIALTTNDSFMGQAGIFIPEGGTQNVSIKGGSDCIDFRHVSCSTVCETPNSTMVLNPYRQNMLGSWRIKRNHSFLSEREYLSANVNPRYDGIYDQTSYSNFWIPDPGKTQLKKTTNSKWVWSSQVTMYSPYGNEIENQDALGRYSSALFGFNKTLPTAVAGNAKYKQIAFESFEENDLFWIAMDCYRPHWEFAVTGPGQAEISNEARHTGKYSIKVSPGNSTFAGAEINGCSYNEDPLDSTHVKWTDCHCVGVFSPDTGTYVVSGWLKQGTDLTDTAYLTSGVKVNLTTSAGVIPQTIYASGPIIEGWQRFYSEFHIDDDVTILEVELFAAEEDTWFDDIRVHPFDASMKTYVYDQVTLKLLAELDDNNYAAIYEYDLEGALSRIKKETVKGIQTLKEIRKSILKTNP